MPYQTRTAISISLLLAAALFSSPLPARAAGNFFDIPVALPPDEFGTILMNRLSEQRGVKPVVFSHWSHRKKYTCRVCHFELEFNFKANTTEMTEAESAGGKYCGSCHDGKEHDGVVVFGHEKPHCDRCHSGSRASVKNKFAELAGLPKAKFGNGINWVRAIETGAIKPVHERSVKASAITFDKTLKLEAEWFNIPPALFPHKTHTAWLDCNNCHPDPFTIKKKTTKHFVMARILQGEFCGLCHLTVAFPMDDCKRCHPGIKSN